MGLRTLIILLIASLSGVLHVKGQNSQQWRDSLAVINKQISQNPYSSDLYLRKAAVNIELQQWEYAHKTYSDILTKEPNNHAALFYRAFVNGKMRRYDLAGSDYETFLTLAPTNIEARLGLAYSLQKRGKRLEALDQYNTIVEQHPDSAVAYASRACLEEEMVLLDAALFDWEKAIALNSSNNDYILSKANLLLKMGKKQKARECLDVLLDRGVARADIEELLKACR